MTRYRWHSISFHVFFADDNFSIATRHMDACSIAPADKFLPLACTDVIIFLSSDDAPRILRKHQEHMGHRSSLTNARIHAIASDTSHHVLLHPNPPRHSPLPTRRHISPSLTSRPKPHRRSPFHTKPLSRPSTNTQHIHVRPPPSSSLLTSPPKPLTI